MVGRQDLRRFADRRDAGRALGAALARLQLATPAVLGLPRGGVVVAAEVAAALQAPLDAVVVRKVAAPGQPELAMGAVGEQGIVVRQERVLAGAGVSAATFDAAAGQQQRAVAERVARFRGGGRAPLELTGRTVVLVDDGIATGSTARAACLVVRAAGASRIVLAVPVGPPGVGERFADVADDVVCLVQPRRFFAVGQAYDDFREVGDDEVVRLLQQV